MNKNLLILVMRSTILFVAASAVITATHGQYFAPYTLSTKKLFTENTIVTLGHSMAFDSAMAVGNDSIFHHYKALNFTPTYISEYCGSYSDKHCYKEDLTRWNGTLFRTNNAGTYWFRTLTGDSLRFEFAIPPGNSSIFFEDDLQRFSIERGPTDTLTVLGYLDSIISYSIRHSDLDDQVISSALNGWNVVIGKELGLINFFQVNSFPYILRPMVLAGNKAPNLGLHQITPAVLNDHQPGDMIQSRYYDGYIFTPSLPYVYTKRTILTRNETPDAVAYQMTREIFGPTASDHSIDTTTETRSKHAIIADIPFDRFDGTLRTFSRTNTLCDIPVWKLHNLTHLYMFPCEFDDCWEAIGTPEKMMYGYSTQFLGIGTSSYSQFQLLSGPINRTISEIIYYKKNGVECGNQVSVGLPEIEKGQLVQIYPNPTHDKVTIESSHLMNNVEIFNANGHVMLQMHLETNLTTVGVSTLNPGWYLVRLQLKDGTRIHRPLIVE